MSNKYAIIENSIVVNSVVAEPEFAQEQGWVELVGDAGIGWSYIDGQFIAPQPIQPTPEEIQAQNKAQAESLLQATDYLESQSIRNTALTPHLVNVDEIDSYRLQLRAIAINPPSTTIEWPTKPDNIWSN